MGTRLSCLDMTVWAPAFTGHSKWLRLLINFKSPSLSPDPYLRVWGQRGHSRLPSLSSVDIPKDQALCKHSAEQSRQQSGALEGKLMC
ncbi:hypothetical protein MHYP_G00042450 [Metynnis hypsauchen]